MQCCCANAAALYICTHGGQGLVLCVKSFSKSRGGYTQDTYLSEDTRCCVDCAVRCTWHKVRCLL